MEKKRLGVNKCGPNPVIVKGDARTSIKPGISRAAQKKLESKDRNQRQALAQLRGKVLFD